MSPRAAITAVIALGFGLGAAGCGPKAVPGIALLEQAKLDAQKGNPDARTLALWGFHALLVDSDAEQARAAFDRAVGSNADPLALHGQMVLALRAADPARAVSNAFDLLEHFAEHPLAAAAARVVFDASGLAKSTDDEILRRGELALPKLKGDAEALVRSAQANVLLARGELERHGEVLKRLGIPRDFTVAGPFSAWHVLSFPELTAAEKTGSLDGLPNGPLGPLVPRALHFADGRLSLAGEAGSGDVYLAATDFETHASGVVVVRTASSMDHVATVDGHTVLVRDTSLRPASTLSVGSLKLSAGKHRLMLRVTKESQQGNLTVAVSRLKGPEPEPFEFHAAQGNAPVWESDAVMTSPALPSSSAPVVATNPVVPARELEGYYPSCQSFYDALAPQAGEVLAAFIAATDCLGRDRDSAKRLLDLIPLELSSAAVRALRADVAFGDRSVSAKVAHGRAARDVEAALEKDKGHLHALQLSAQLALDDGRPLDSLETLKQASAAVAQHALLAALQARLYLALNVDPLADASALDALKALPGHCDALNLRYDLARRKDAVAEADRLLEGLNGCPQASSRRVEHLIARGKLEQAWAQAQTLLKNDENDLQVAQRAISVAISLRRYAEAVQLLERLRRAWPRSTVVLKQLADVHELAGRTGLALKAREEALLLDGADLSLRRAVVRQKTGRELLDEHAISTDEALKAYAAAPFSENVPSAYILDAAVVRAYPDGSMVDRIHIIQKALDQSGVADVAEVRLPAGAQVLKLRTLKPDGKTLEPESIDGKESVSLPGVQVGDYVEYEYLEAHPPRGPGLPGFTAGSFYFQISRQPNNWSTYKVIAPKGLGLKVEAHNMDVPGPRTVGGEEVFFHEERRVAPYIPEPQSPASGNEWLPFVTVGAGASGNDGVISVYADAYLDKGAVTHEVVTFAHEAAQGAQGVEAVKRVYAAVMKKLSGRDAGLSTSAAASVAQDRGSRTWLLRAALKALDFDVRLAAVRTFAADPAVYFFPNEQLLPYVCLRVDVPNEDGPASEVWLDPMVRFAPFGQLPESASDKEALLFPEPGKPLVKTRTPARPERAGKQVVLEMQMFDDGHLEGRGSETYQGFEAAQLVEALESLSVDQRDQALQGALSRYFGGAYSSKLEVSAPREVGAEVTVKYQFRASRFARKEGEQWVLGALTFPTTLGRRYLSLSDRRTPLYIESSELTHTQVQLKLPAGYALVGPVAEAHTQCLWGRYVRKEAQQADVLTVDEELKVSQARVPSKSYPEFAQFAGEVDLMQGRDLLLEKKR